MVDLTATEPAKPEKPAAKAGPEKWWQWFFIYPAFGLALLTAAPDWVGKAKEFYLNLQDRDLDEAREQQQLLAENLTCLQQEFQRFETIDGLKIDARICDRTAAIILFVNNEGSQRRLIAIDVPGLFEVERAQAFSLISPAYAQTMITDVQLAQAEDPDAVVRCVEQTDARTVVRHVELNGQCYDESIDMLTGWVTPSVQVPCEATCEAN